MARVGEGLTANLVTAYRNFAFDPNFSPDDFRAFIDYLDSNHQHYIPIVDAAYAVTRNDSDIYDSYTRGAELDVWLKNPDGSEYRGRPHGKFFRSGVDSDLCPSPGRVWPGM